MKTMKKLQSNFTTPEQSKRLLELGVPADSADLFYHSLNKIIQRLGKFDLCIVGNTTISSLKETADEEGLIVIPCWSVGRLIEIYELCFVMFDDYNYSPYTTLVERVIEYIEDAIKDNRLDFSKFEE